MDKIYKFPLHILNFTLNFWTDISQVLDETRDLLSDVIIIKISLKPVLYFDFQPGSFNSKSCISSQWENQSIS